VRKTEVEIEDDRTGRPAGTSDVSHSQRSST
jgi:hypothetical protein